MESVAVLQKKGSFWSEILKGVLLATSYSLVCILLFALTIKLFGITDSWIMPINQVIKVLSMLFGCWFSLKSSQKGLLKGMIIGFIYTALAYILFSLLSQNFAINLSLLNDLLFGVLLGGICGMIVVNIRK